MRSPTAFWTSKRRSSRVDVTPPPDTSGYFRTRCPLWSGAVAPAVTGAGRRLAGRAGNPGRPLPGPCPRPPTPQSRQDLCPTSKDLGGQRVKIRDRVVATYPPAMICVLTARAQRDCAFAVHTPIIARRKRELGASRGDRDLRTGAR